jgi:hypothetical protein
VSEEARETASVESTPAGHRYPDCLCGSLAGGANVFISTIKESKRQGKEEVIRELGLGGHAAPESVETDPVATFAAVS